MPLNSIVVDANGRPTEVLEAGNGDPLVFLHGGGIVEGVDFLDQLADRYRVLVPLVPGFGRTELEPAPTSLDDLTAHLADVFDALGLQQAVLVGHSLGGWRAVGFAAAHPERVSRLVLAAPFGMNVPGHPMTNMLEHTPEERHEILTYDSSVWEGRPTEVSDSNFAAARGREMASMSGFMPGPFDPDLPSRVATLDADTTTLVLWGEADRLIPFEHAQVWAASIPFATLRSFPATGHLVFHERPEAVEALADREHAGERDLA
jgi:pimeloyl-ACP methyl ester carboxylesterase